MSQPDAPVVVVGAGDWLIPNPNEDWTPPTYTSANVAASGGDLEPGDDSVVLTSAARLAPV